MTARTLKAPLGLDTYPHGECPGCGHGIAMRLIYEVIDEMGMKNNHVAVHDLACGSNMLFISQTSGISCAHGRVKPTATGIKRIRPDMLIFSYEGDGASYSIGMQHTVHTAMRDENITSIVVNNTVFGMTGGQMSPTSMIGQKTTSSPNGRMVNLNGNPVDIAKLYSGMDIAYMARGAVCNSGDTRQG